MKRKRQRRVLVGGQVLVNVHTPNQCKGEHCTIHRPSDHHMVTWPQNWRGDRYLMERICPHLIGHPDPDDPNPDKVHGCDGCCVPPSFPTVTARCCMDWPASPTGRCGFCGERPVVVG